MERKGGTPKSKEAQRKAWRKKMRTELKGKCTYLVPLIKAEKAARIKEYKQNAEKNRQDTRIKLLRIAAKKHPADAVILKVFGEAPINEFGKKFNSLTELCRASEGKGYPPSVLVVRIHVLAAGDYFGERIGRFAAMNAKAPLSQKLVLPIRPVKKKAPQTPTDLTFGLKEVKAIKFTPSPFPPKPIVQSNPSITQTTPAPRPKKKAQKPQASKRVLLKQKVNQGLALGRKDVRVIRFGE